MYHVQSLEGRTLFSGSLSQTVQADLMKISADAQSAHADILKYQPILVADGQALKADLAGTKVPGNHVLAAKLQQDGRRCVLVMDADAFLVGKVGGAAAKKVFADKILLTLHPYNPELQAKFAADVAAAKAIGSTLLAKLGTDVAYCAAKSAADLNALLALNSTNTRFVSDAQKLQTDGGAFVNTVAADVQTIQSDLNTLVNDVVTG